MTKITKLEAGRRQVDSAIRMFFKNEDIVAVHTVSRAAFRVLYDITAEGNVKTALDVHIKKVGQKRFNEETNFLKHADVDPDAEINDDFNLYTEAGIGMAIALYQSHSKTLTPEMKGFLIWSKFMRPDLFEIPTQLRKDIDEWVADSRTDPNKIEGQERNRAFGDAIVHWCRLRMSR